MHNRHTKRSRYAILLLYVSLTVVIDLSLVILFVVKSIEDKGVLVIARKAASLYSSCYI